MAANGEVENEELEKNLSPAHQFAEKVFSDSKISFRCTVKKPDGTTCGKTYAGPSINNFERHLQKHHSAEHKAVTDERASRKRQREAEAADRSHKKKKTSVLNGVKISMENIIDNCISMVTDSSRPFTAIDDPGLQGLIQPLLDAVPDEERRAVSAFTIRRRVEAKSVEITEALTEELRGVLVCVKVDSASRGTRNFLGVNVQRVKDGKLHLRTLATKEIHDKCTGVHLKKMVEEILAEHGITPEYVYSMTTDNGSNMVLAGELLGRLAEEILALHPDYDENGDPIDEDDDDAAADAAEEDDAGDLPSDDEEDLPLSVVRERLDAERAAARLAAANGRGVDAINDVTLGQGEGNQVCGVRCAAHCLQLAVKDALKATTTQRLLGRMRRLAKSLRTKTNASFLRRHQHRLPKLDNATRWNSSDDMLESLVELQEVCREYSHQLDIRPPTDRDWRMVRAVLESLKPAKIAMKKLQQEQLVMGDFYGVWLQCQADTAQVDTPLARRLVQAMHHRQKLMLNGPAFLSAIYMDPRYSIMLSSEQAVEAEGHLVRLHAKLARLQAGAPAPPANANAAAAAPPAAEPNSLERILRAREAAVAGDAGRAAARTESRVQVEILPKLRWILHHNRIPSEENILAWWHSMRYAEPDLYRLATVVLAVPATQVSVERLFSAMKHVLSDRRLCLTGPVINQILKIRQFHLWNGGLKILRDYATMEVDPLPPSSASSPAVSAPPSPSIS